MGAFVFTSVPSPNWPVVFPPQHLRTPVASNAQAWSPPENTALTPLVNPLTSTDVRRSVFVPSPNCPSILSPQHLAPAPVVRAQVWSAPEDTALTPLVRPFTSTGMLRW